MNKTSLVLAVLLSSQTVLAQTQRQFEFNDEVVLSGPCKTKVPLTDQELIAWTKSLGGEPLPWIQVGNKVFRNEYPELAIIYRKLLSRDDAKVKYEGYKKRADDGTMMMEIRRVNQSEETLVDVKTKSDSVLGALQEIFGKRQGLQLAYLLHAYRFNGSYLRFTNVSELRVDELDSLILAAGDLPPQLVPAYFDQQMTKFMRGYSRANSSKGILADTIEGEYINFFDLWTQDSQEMRQSTIIHEFGHVVSSLKGDLGESKEWMQTSNWYVDDAGVRRLQGPKVTSYGGTKSGEDFAESFTAYIYASDYLKKNFPAKYSYLARKVFKNVEYGENSLCDGAITSQSLKATQKLLSGVRLKPVDMKVAAQRAERVCAWGENLNKCLSQVIKDQILADMVAQTERDTSMDPIRRRKNLMRNISSSKLVSSQLIEQLKSTVASRHAETMAIAIAAEAKYASSVNFSTGFEVGTTADFVAGVCRDAAVTSQFLFNGNKKEIDQGELFHVAELKELTQKTCLESINPSMSYFKMNVNLKALEAQALRNLMDN